jgi:hypothetical protein
VTGPPRPGGARLGPWRVALGVVGAAAISYGGWSILTGGIETSPAEVGRWLVAGVLAHDLVIASVVAVAGWLLTRLVPLSIRPTVQGGLYVAGAVTLVAIPVLSGRGGHGNPSSNPLDYPRNLLFLLAAIAAVTAVACAVRLAARRRAAERGTDPVRGL